ncbi:MAG: ABC transporter substrate-binding protein [Alphaproteobacteria bacterium]|nr:ABC transporter substrate-binding protein [Alphaproteobacteria bacterium]
MRGLQGWIVTILCVVTSATGALHAGPQRVVSTFLCTDEYVYRLVPRDHIAALSYEASDRHPVVSTIADKVSGIRAIRPSTETVLALSPDLVVMYAHTMPRLRDNLRRLGVPVVDVPWANSLAAIRSVTRMLGDRLQARPGADALLAEMDRKIAVAQAAAPRPPVPTIIYEPNGYTGTGAITDEIMRMAGAMDATPPALMTRRGTLPIEAVIAVAPELLILGGEPYHDTARATMILHHPALAALEGRTTMEYATLTPLLCPGPWSVDAAKTLGDMARKARAESSRRSSRAARSDSRH